MSNTATAAHVRQVNGHTLPAVGHWDIDPGHADVSFIGRHFMVTKVRGRFTALEGVVSVAEDMNDSTVEVTIDMASVESGNRTRDEHLRSAELFDVQRFPQATFRSTRVDWHGDRGSVTGDLTIHGVTRSVTLDAGFEGYVKDPWGGHRAVFSASTKLNREEFGLTWNVALETGGVLVSKEIKIEIDVETVLR